jgi:hypothetical protein
MRQKNQVKLNLGTGGAGEARNAATQESEILAAKACLERPAAAGPSTEAVVERSNLLKALEQVQRNKGAPGIDGMTIAKLTPYLKEHWPAIRALVCVGFESRRQFLIAFRDFNHHSPSVRIVEVFGEGQRLFSAFAHAAGHRQKVCFFRHR